MKFTYTEYYEEEPNGKVRIQASGQTKPYKDPVEIVIRIEMERETYERRKAKYKDPIWEKVHTLFKPKYSK